MNCAKLARAIALMAALALGGCQAILGLDETHASGPRDAGSVAWRERPGPLVPAVLGSQDQKARTDGSVLARMDGSAHPLTDGMDAGSSAHHGSGMDAGSAMDATANTGTPPQCQQSPAGSDAANASCLDGTIARDAGAKDAGHTSSAEAGPDAQIDSDSGILDDDAEVKTPWRPTSLPGLVLWLDGSEGVSVAQDGTVERWRDLSGSGNDALQTRQNRRPMVVTDAVNAHPAIQFDGVASYLAIADSASFDFADGPFTIEMVAAWSNSLAVTNTSWGYALLAVKQTGNLGFVMTANADITGQGDMRSSCGFWVDAYFPTSWVEQLNDGKFRAYAGRRTDETTLEVRVDGTPAMLGFLPAGSSATAEGAELLLGGASDTSHLQGLNGAIAEMVIIKGAITDADLARLEHYFNHKYQLWNAATLAALFAAPSFLPVTIADGILFP